jgi:hypothetical protein
VTNYHDEPKTTNDSDTRTTETEESSDPTNITTGKSDHIIDVDEGYESEATAKTGWHTVQSNNLKHQAALYNFGIHASRISQHTEEGFHPDDIKMLLQIIHNMDSEAIFLPHTNNPKLARTWHQTKANYNFKSMMNITSMRWGKPADNKHKSEFSFYVSSNSLASVKAITADLQVRSFLETTNIRLSFHALHESQRSSVGFLLGKSVQHAYWNDLTARLTDHISDKLQIMKTLQSLAPTVTKPPPMPVSIPIQLNPNTLSIGQVQAKGLAIYVGSKDKTALERLLQRYPFRDVEIVADAWKRSDPDEYANRLHLHNKLDEDSTAIKITNTNEDMRDHLRVSRHRAACSELINSLRPMPQTGQRYRR